MVKVKICGLKTMDEALYAASFGADCVGFIFSHGKRQISSDTARKIVDKLPPFITKAGVFVNESMSFVTEACQSVGLDLVQFHGDESPEFIKAFTEETRYKVIKAIRVKEKQDLNKLDKYNCSGYLLDSNSKKSYGGTGQVFNWDHFPKEPEKPCILSGGLTPDNVTEAVLTTNPYGVCVSSGVEHQGTKSKDKIRDFITNAKQGSEFLCKKKKKKDTSVPSEVDLSQNHLWVP